eukprot:TRINITY_DN169_c0_g1_i1.p3 TRINITY_DN169_c0_g1~~TRINITY_DN169_c0_g1_i1.p3  ORF type:complete len:132 (+),score=24.23 TRINITY_DN169_c0_g1_i1:233-628(+)
MVDEIDDKDRQTFIELQKNYTQQRAQHKSITQQLLREDKLLQVASLTKKEVEEYPQDVKAYKSVGRAYFLYSKESILKELTEDENNANSNKQKLNKAKEAVIKGVDSSEKELREFLATKPALAKRLATSQM